MNEQDFKFGAAATNAVAKAMAEAGRSEFTLEDQRAIELIRQLLTQIGMGNAKRDATAKALGLTPQSQGEAPVRSGVATVPVNLDQLSADITPRASA